MSTYYDLMFRDNQKEEHILSKGKVLTFKYAEPFSCHYLCRVAVDNHNDMRHERGKNIRLDCRMYGSPTGDKSESLPF